MLKNIWYISQYCTIENKNTIGSRGWLLSKEFAKKGNNTVVITSDSFDLIDSNEAYYNKLNTKNLTYKIIHIFNILGPKSLSRMINWVIFELKLFLLNKKLFSKPDVIIISSLSILTILNGIYLKRKYNCKLIFEIRDIWPLTLIELGNYSHKNPLIIFLKFIEKLGYKKSDHIVGTMPKIDRHVHNVLGFSKPTHCIPMGVTEELFQNKYQIPGFIQKHLKSSTFNIIYSGKIGMTNALSTFFKAAQILKNDLNIKFVLIGDGPDRKKFIKNFGNLQNIIYFNKTKRNEMLSILSLASVAYFSTLKSKVYDYGQSANKLIDYMASGKPIIASYSGYQSMINEAKCGYFLPAEDERALVNKILELKEMNKQELQAIGLRGKKWLLENRQYSKLADKYLNIMEK